MSVTTSPSFRFLPYKIFHQIFIILLLLVVVPLIILGFLLIKTSQTAIQTSVLRDHKEIVTRATGQVSEFMKSPRQALTVTAAMVGVLHANPWKQETAIVELAIQYPIFSRISIIDLNGQETAVSHIGLPLENYANDQGYLVAKTGKFYQSKVQVTEDKSSIMKMSIPIRQLGKITGVMMAEVNLRGVWDIVDSIKIGDTGRAYLIDGEGRLLSHPDKKLVLENSSLLYESMVQNLLKKRSGSHHKIDSKGESWIVSYAPVPDMDWGLVIFQAEKEAYAFLNVMKGNSWMLILLSVMATAFISLFLSRFMSRPLELLIEGTKRIVREDFDQPIAVDQEDEIGNLLKTFNDLMAKLKTVRRMEKLSAIGRAATAIAHQLKNSLTLVNTFIQILPERYQQKEFIDEFMKVVPPELDSWRAMLIDMTMYSNLKRFPKELLNINQAVQDAAVLVTLKAEQSNIKLELSLKPNLPMIWGNADKLKQVVLNLIANALEATSNEGKIFISTRLAWQSQESIAYVVLEVKDSGKGISQEELSKIFEPFYSTKVNGLGLGLIICREIVQQHGGQIKVISAPSQGSTFTIYLPVGKK